MKKRYIIILVIIGSLILIGNFLFKTSQMVLDSAVFEDEEETKIEKNENVIIGTGNFTSFNIEELDTGFWTKVDEVYVKSEETVNADTKIIKVSNNEATGTIYSTISGKFFIEEKQDKNKYYIYDLNSVGIEIEVEEIDSVKLKLGQKANIKFSSIAENFEGRICYISKIPVKGIVKAKILMDYTDKVKFGCIGTVKIDLDAPIDENIKEFDIKNSFKKIGKLKMTLKDNLETEIPINMEELMQGYENELLEFDTKEISEYYSNLWNEYWREYWKKYYSEYQTFEVIEPDENSINGLDKIDIGGEN